MKFIQLSLKLLILVPDSFYVASCIVVFEDQFYCSAEVLQECNKRLRKARQEAFDGIKYLANWSANTLIRNAPKVP